jgi:hypothetical protein
MAEETAEQKLARYEYVIEAYVAELTKLREENARLTAAAGAHGVLKAIYLDRDLPESFRAKAASAALPHEVPKLMPERMPLELKAVEPEMTLGQLHEVRLEREKKFMALSLEERAALIPGCRNGNGSGDKD